MNRTLQLQQDKAARLDEANAILAAAQKDNRAMTAEERSAFDTKKKEVEDIVATIDAEQSMAALSNIPNDLGERRNRPALQNPHDNTLDKPYAHLGEQLIAVRNAALRPDMADPRLYEIQKRAASGASEAVPGDGGFLVYPDFAAEILKLAHDTGQIYTRARSLPLSEATNAIKIPGIDEQSRADGSRWGGVRMYWQNEADALTASKPKFRLVELVTKKLTGLYYATDELLQDARALGSIVMQAFGEEMGFKLDDAVFRGTGAGQPQGILSAPCLVTVSKETGQAAATIVYQNVLKMWQRMWARSRANAVWFINQDTEPQLYTMSLPVGTAGSPVFLPAGGASVAPYATLFGRPVVPVEQCDTLGTVGDIVLADYSQYVTVDKGNMQSAVSMHVRFLNDEQTFRWIYRVDGQPIWHTALTPFKGSNTLSPFVALQTRS